MFKLIFEDGYEILIEDTKALKIYMSGFKGKEAPKYLGILFKSHKLDNADFKTWELKFYYNHLNRIETYDDDNILICTIPAPDNFIDLHYEEGDMFVEYGDPLYADEV